MSQAPADPGALPAAGAERLLQPRCRPDQLPCPQRLLLPRALPLAALPAAAKPAASADVAEADADRGALAAQPEVTGPLSRLTVRHHDPRSEPRALAAHAGICAGGGEQSPSLQQKRGNGVRACGLVKRQAGRYAICKTVFDPDLDQHGNPTILLRPTSPPETQPGCAYPAFVPPARHRRISGGPTPPTKLVGVGLLHYGLS